MGSQMSYSKPVIFQAPLFGSAGDGPDGAFMGTGFQRTYVGGVNYDRIISPTLVAEVRIGVAHYHNEAGHRNGCQWRGCSRPSCSGPNPKTHIFGMLLS